MTSSLTKLLAGLVFIIFCTPTVQNVPVSVEESVSVSSVYAAPGVIADAIDRLINSLLNNLEVTNASLISRELLCNYVYDKLVKLSTQGKVRVTGIDLTSRPAADAQIKGVSLMPFSLIDLLQLDTAEESVLSNIFISKVSYDCETMNLAISSQIFGSVHTVLPGLLQLRNVSFELVLDSSLEPSLTFNGEWLVANTELRVKMKYSSTTRQFQIASELSGTALTIQNILRELTSLSLPLPSRFITAEQSFKITGVVDSLSSGTVIISARFTTRNRAYVILKKNNSNFETAVAVEIARIPLTDLIEGVARQDISSIPFFGSLVLPNVGLSVSTASISSELVRECFNDTHLLLYYGHTVPSGFAAFVDFDFSDDIFTLTYANNTASFGVRDGSFSVRDLLQLIPSIDIPAIRFPPGISNLLDININNFGLDLLRGRVTVEIQLQSTLRYFNGHFQIANPMITVIVNLSNHAITFEASGEVTVADTEFSLSIVKERNNKYYLDASAESIMLHALLSSFSANLLPSELQSISSSLPFLNFGIRDANMVLPLDTTFSQVFLSGTPVIAGYPVVDMTATIFRLRPGSTNAVLGLHFGSPNLADLLGTIAPIASNALKALPFLDQELNTNLIIAPRDISGISLSRDDAVRTLVKKGITVRAAIHIPPANSCDSDPFCVVARYLLPPNTVLNIDSTISSAIDFRLKASLATSITIPGGLTITGAGVEVRAGGDTSIGIVGMIALQNPRLDFTARIFNSVSGVILQMIASGCWNDAFGIPIIDICNVQGSIGFGPTTIITQVSLGGEVRLGVSSCSVGEPIIAIGHVGLDTVNPANNYFYANFLQGLTISALFGAFCIDTSVIPSLIANSGLQPGFLTSYTASVVGKSIPEIGLYVPPGFQLNGTVNILGLQASANISATPMAGIYMSVSLPPLNAGNLLHVFASSSDRSRGPYLIADLRPPHTSVEASGYISVLGISQEARLLISQETMSIAIEGRILGIVDSTLTMTAPNTGGFASAEFTVSGSFSFSFSESIENSIKQAANGAANAASSAINAAQNLVSQRNEAFNRASTALTQARNELSQAQRKFDDASRKINRLSREVDSVCHIRSCGSVCVPGCGGCSCSWSGCSCDCSSCHTRITDPTCKAANVACEALKAPIRHSLNLARASLNGLSRTLDAARGAFNAAQTSANAANRGLQEATNSLSVVRDNFRVGAQLANKIASLGSDGLLNIQQMTFEESLAAANSGRFSLTVRVRVLGSSQTVNINANLHDITGTITRPLADLLGIGNLI